MARQIAVYSESTIIRSDAVYYERVSMYLSAGIFIYISM